MLRRLFVFMALFVPSAASAQVPQLTPLPCADLKWEYADPAFQPLTGAKAFFGRYDGGVYRIEVPDNWNGELILWAHGNRPDTGAQGGIVQAEFPGSNGSAAPGIPSTAGSPRLRQHWIGGGFAWAASSYRCNGSIAGIGLLDTLALRDLFAKVSPTRSPSRLYLVGQSMGGGITVRALHLLPNTFAGGLAMCSVVVPEQWDQWVATTAAAEALTGVRLGADTFDADLARMRTILGPLESLTSKGRQLASVQIALSGGPRPFAMEGLAARYYANIEDGAGRRNLQATRAATNVNTRYTLDERLGLTAAELNRIVQRKEADAALRSGTSPYFEVSVMDGRIHAPLMTLHGTGDLQVPISGQRMLRELVDKAGNSRQLVQRIMRIPGHCRFSDEEQIQAFDDLVTWVRTGKTPEGDDVLADLRDAGRRFTNPVRPGDPGTLAVTAATP